MKKFMILLLALQPFMIITLLTYYQFGVRQLGDPVEYRQKQMEIMQAIEDSIMAYQAVLTPESVGDSTMAGLEMHTSLFEETVRSDRRMGEVKAAIDSLKREREELESLSNEVARRRAMLEDLKQRALDEKIVNLAKIYDNMKPPQSVPLFLEMSDTLAVLIMTNMQERNASRTLGAMAEQDIDKATRITKLLAMMGIVKLD